MNPNQPMNNQITNNNVEPTNVENINNFNNQMNPFYEEPNNNYQEETPMLNQQQNRFITNSIDNNMALNDLNIDGTYNNMPQVDYSQEPQVQENLKQKNTITITSEGKVFIIIILVLLLFIFVMPYIFDLIRNIKY